jgi:hypothetical protein
MCDAGKRRLGRILRDGGLISDEQLAQALEEQSRSNDLLGEVLVKMGIVDAVEIKAALAIQEHLGSVEEAVRLAAGVREMLGTLLLQSGKVSAGELEHALAEHKSGGAKLGETCVTLGLLSQQQLDGVLAFQRQQECQRQEGTTPLRLGELLVCAGYISREQLDDALKKQGGTRKRLGEVLVEEGYAHPAHIGVGIRLQRMLQGSVLAAILSLSALTIGGCGSGGGAASTANPTAVGAVSTTASPAGGGGAAPAAVPTTTSYFKVTSDEYGLVKPNFLYSTDNQAFWSIQANVAASLTDIETAAVYRIDVPKSVTPMPQLNRTYALEEGGQYEKFPGSFLVMDGKKSSNKKVEKGTITFTPDSISSQKVTGTFDVTMTDYDINALPAPQYRLKGSFSFVMGSYGPVVESNLAGV